MGTLITLAELHREKPVVLFARWFKFDLLFRRDPRDVRLREKWDPSDAADYVFSVTMCEVKGKLMWRVKPHALMKLGDCFKCSSVPFLDLDQEGFTALLAPGQLFSAAYQVDAPDGISHHVEIGMRLDLYRRCEVDEVARTGQLLKPSLENLPFDVHHLLLGRLPLYEVMYVLPYVSQKMFDVVKAGGDWTEVYLTNGVCPSIENLDVWLSSSAVVEKCTVLQVKGGSQRCIEEWSGLDLLSWLPVLLWDYCWTKLEELHLCGVLDDESSKLMISSLKLGRLPALRALTLEDPKETSWHDLSCCNLSSLRHLKIGIYPCKNEEEPVWNHDELWGQFSKLETLSVIFRADGIPSEARRMFPRPTQHSSFLPCLKTLSIDRLPRAAAGLIQQELQLFSGLPIERLFIYNLPKVAGEVTAGGIPASWLFSTFSRLSDLGVDSSAFIDWGSAPESALRRLVHLRAPLRESDGIPIQKMVNLEAAFVQLVCNATTTGPFCLKNLMKLPKLTNLKVVCPIYAHVLIPEDGLTCSIRSLDSHFTFAWDTKRVGLQRSVVPNLVRRVLTKWDYGYDHGLTARLFRGVVDEMDGLVQLDVRGSSSRAFFESREYLSTFPATAWDVRLLGTSRIVFHLRSAKDRLEKALFVFDDAFFSN